MPQSAGTIRYNMIQSINQDGTIATETSDGNQFNWSEIIQNLSTEE